MKTLLFILFLLPSTALAEEGTVFTEKEILIIAFKNNASFKEFKLGVKEAQELQKSNSGLYPWLLNADGGFRFDEQPTVDVIQSGTRKSTVFQGGVEIIKQFTIGTRLSARLDVNRSSAEIPFTLPGLNIDQIQKIGPNYGTSLSFNITQPILRGFGSQLYDIPLASARQKTSLAELQLNRQAADLVNNVLQAYWQWVRANWELESARARLKRTAWLTKTTDTQIQAGTLAELEHDIVEQQNAVAEQALLSAELAVEDAADEIKKWVADPDFSPKNIPKKVELGNMHSLEESIKNAIASSPELQLFDAEVDAAKLAQVASENDKKVKLDVIGSLTQSGLSEDVLDSLGQVGSLDFTSFFLGLSFSMPLDNSKANHQNESEKIKVIRAGLKKQAAELALKTQIKKAFRLIHIQTKRAHISEKEIVLAKKNLSAIQEKFSAGRASHLEVMQVEDNLLDAELRNRQTKIDLVLASIALRRLDGSLLDYYSIQILK